MRHTGVLLVVLALTLPGAPSAATSTEAEPSPDRLLYSAHVEGAPPAVGVMNADGSGARLLSEEGVGVPAFVARRLLGDLHPLS